MGYDAESLSNPAIRAKYNGPVHVDHYGRAVPKSAHGSANLPCPSSSSKLITEAVIELYNRIVNPDLLIRYLNLTTNHVIDEHRAAEQQVPQQLDLFTDYEALEQQRQADADARDKERRLQEARLHIKERFGKNAILKGIDFEEGATTRDRNKQIGGHKA